MFGAGVFVSSSNFRFTTALPVPMRTPPSVTYSAASAFNVVGAVSLSAASAVSADASSTNHLMTELTVSGATAGQAGIATTAFGGTSAYINASAEL
jgi:hypothetical protein